MLYLCRGPKSENPLTPETDFVDALLLFGLHASEAGHLQSLSATFCILPNNFQSKINSVTDGMARKQ